MKVFAGRTRGIAALGLLAMVGFASFLFVGGGAASGASQSKGTVSLSATKLGKILVASNGRTLYLFEKDKGGRSSCSGICATYWPPLTSATKPTGGAGLKASLLGRVHRSDGKWQVTYNKHPLYTFGLDTAAGQTHGEGLNDFGGSWYAVSASGAAKVQAASNSTSSSSTTTSTYTY
jgi:predicted lipoprotein with Yx(FWY)xxD motif